MLGKSPISGIFLDVGSTEIGPNHPQSMRARKNQEYRKTRSSKYWGGFLPFFEGSCCFFFSRLIVCKKFCVFFFYQGLGHRSKTQGQVQNSSDHDLQWPTGWWFGCHFWHFPINIGLLSSSQLTNSYFSEGWPNHQPAKILRMDSSCLYSYYDC